MWQNLVKDEKITFSLRWYSGNGLSFDEVRKYWLDKLSLNETNMRKCFIDHNKENGYCKKKGKLPYGIGCITIPDVSIVQKIFGSIQCFIGFKYEEWLWNP